MFLEQKGVWSDWRAVSKKDRDECGSIKTNVSTILRHPPLTGGVCVPSP